MNISTPSPRSADTPRAHYELAASATEWVASIAAITTADQQGEPRPDRAWPDATGRAIDDHGVRIDALYSPANTLPDGWLMASDLLDAAWNARILTGPYRPILLPLPELIHSIALEPGPGLPLFAAWPEPRTQLVGDAEPGPSSALAFLRNVVTRANTLLGQLDDYLGLCMTAAEEAARAAEHLLAERDVAPYLQHVQHVQQRQQRGPRSDADPAVEPPSADRYGQALALLDRLTKAVHLAGTYGPALTPFHPAPPSATGPTELPGQPGLPGSAERNGIDGITLDDKSQAFYQGVAAGARAVEALSSAVAGTPGADQVMKTAYFWLAVGMHLQATRPGASEQEQEAFITGARLRAPEPDEPLFLLRIDEAPDADAPDVDDADPDLRFRRLGRVIWRVGEAVFSGDISGVAVNDTGKVIGTFQLRTPL